MKPLLPVTEHGYRIGETHHRAKLSDDAVDQVHALRATGTSYGQLAAAFGVAKSTIRDICSGRCRANTPHHYARKPGDSMPGELIAPLPLALPDLETGDDWTPEPGPSVESLGLPPITDEEPGQRAMRLVCWAVTKEPQHDDD